MRMLTKLIKLCVAFVVLLHFLGLTQVLAATCKDKSSFASMMSMTEEENKKEKDDKENDAEWKAFQQKHSEEYTSISHFNIQQGYLNHIQAVTPQYITDQPTPPPDFTA